MSEERLKRRLAAIVVAEVAGFGRLTEANEEATLSDLRRHRVELIVPLVEKHHGRIFKDVGESLLIEFASALEAGQCAVDIQRGLEQRNMNVPQDRQIKFRIGINLSDVIVQGEDFFGDDVNMAARLAGLAPPGGIACSAGIRFQLGSRLGLAFEDAGEKTVKNISQPVHVFLVNTASALPPRPSTFLPDSPAQPIRIRSDKTSIAVLPFANMSGDPEQEYFSDGITEDIITDLSKVSELFVLSRNAVFQHKGKRADSEQLGKELGVAYLAHGSVRKAGGKVRITAQLTESASGGHVWADRFDRNLTDIFALQDEITKAIVEQLKVKLLPKEKKAIEKAPTTDVEAYTYYLKGREFFHRGSKDFYLMAKRMFAKAIEIDPDYARAYAGLADCDAFLYMDYSENVADAVLRNSEKALSLQDDLIEARASRGLALAIVHRFDEAEREFARALVQDPNHFETHFFHGRSSYSQGKLEETALHWERAAEVKPEDYQALILLNQVYASMGRQEDATRAAQRGVERAKKEFARNPENPRPAYFIATAMAKLGDPGRGEQWAKLALAIAPDDYLTLYNIACFYSVANRFDDAFAMLQRLLPISNAEMKDWILIDSDLDPMRADPRWKDIETLARHR